MSKRNFQRFSVDFGTRSASGTKSVLVADEPQPASVRRQVVLMAVQLLAFYGHLTSEAARRYHFLTGEREFNVQCGEK